MLQVSLTERCFDFHYVPSPQSLKTRNAGIGFYSKIHIDRHVSALRVSADSYLPNTFAINSMMGEQQ